MTDHKTKDRQMAKPVMGSIGFDNIDEMLGDGGYDSLEIYSALQKRGVQTLMPPSPNARVHNKRERIYGKGDTVDT